MLESFSVIKKSIVKICLLTKKISWNKFPVFCSTQKSIFFLLYKLLALKKLISFSSISYFFNSVLLKYNIFLLGCG